MITLGQAALGVGALGWAVFLLPRTGILWWLAGNVAYGGLALTAAGLRVGSRRTVARAVAVAGTSLFVVSNGAAATLACSTGGACGTVVGIAGALVALQALLFIAAPEA